MVQVLDGNGSVSLLPYSLRLGFARYVARRDGLARLKRYAIDRVYHARRIAQHVHPVHPKEFVSMRLGWGPTRRKWYTLVTSFQHANACLASIAFNRSFWTDAFSCAHSCIYRIQITNSLWKVECAFDVVTESPGNLIADAEIILVAQEVITAFPALGINNFIVKLNHPQLVKVSYRSWIGPVKAFSSHMPQ